MCKKQTSVSHSSTESEIISLDAGLRLDGIRSLDLWDLIDTVLDGNTNQNRKEQCDCSRTNVKFVLHRTLLTKRKQSQRAMNDLDDVDFIPSIVQSSHQQVLL